MKSTALVDNSYLNTETGGAGQKQLQTVLNWQHQRGGVAYCLARVSAHPNNDKAIAVLTNIEFRYGDNTLASDYVGAAKALMPLVEQEMGLRRSNVTWLIQFGIYFYFAAPSGESFCQVLPGWKIQKHERDDSEMQSLSSEEVADIMTEYGIYLRPGEEVLVSLGWNWKGFKRSSER